MQGRRQRSNRKVLLVVPLVWSALVVGEAVATGADGGPADAGADGGSTVGRDNLCSVAGSRGFGTALGAGCC